MKKMLKIKSLKRVPMLKNSNLTARDDREKLQNCTSTSYIYISLNDYNLENIIAILHVTKIERQKIKKDRERTKREISKM